MGDHYRDPIDAGCVRRDGRDMTLSHERDQERAGRESLTSRYKSGEQLPAAVVTHMEERVGAWEGNIVTTEIVIRNPAGSDVSAVMETFELAQPDVVNLSAPEQIKVAQLQMAYGIQPFHIHLQKYGGDYSMSLTYEGRLFCARKSMKGTFAGCVARAMTEQERIDNLIPDGQSASIATVTQVIGGKAFEVANGIGRAGRGKDDGKGGSPIAMSNPQEMADTRAKRRALSEAAPLGVDISVMTPGGVIDDADYEVAGVDTPAQIPSEATRDTPPDTVGDLADTEPMFPSSETLTAEQAVGVLNALKEVGLTKADVDALPADPLFLRKQGFSPEQVAARIHRAHIARLAAEEPQPEQLTDVEELPWGEGA